MIRSHNRMRAQLKADYFDSLMIKRFSISEFRIMIV